MKTRTALIATLTFVLAACGGSDGEPSDTVDGLTDEQAATLEQYLQAIPSEERVTAATPIDANADGLPTTGSAEFAKDSIAAATAINSPAVAMVQLLKQITAFPPSVFNSDTREFVWGPGDNEDGVGQILLYIRENEAGADFKYEYAFVRLVDRDMATASPVIWGGANPDPAETGKDAGVTLWDFDASNAFDALHDPDFALVQKTQGRFVMMYGADPEAEADTRFNVAVFRNFIPEDATGDPPQPFDAEYFYGRVVDANGQRFDFLDWQLTGDLCDTDPDSCFDNNVVADQDEAFRLMTVFVDKGIGRAEVNVSGGDLASDVAAVECWDANLDRTFVSISADGVVLASEGQCEGVLGSTLGELGVPSVDDIDPELLAALTCVADQGLDGDCE